MNVQRTMLKNATGNIIRLVAIFSVRATTPIAISVVTILATTIGVRMVTKKLQTSIYTESNTPFAETLLLIAHYPVSKDY